MTLKKRTKAGLLAALLAIGGGGPGLAQDYGLGKPPSEQEPRADGSRYEPDGWRLGPLLGWDYYIPGTRWKGLGPQPEWQGYGQRPRRSGEAPWEDWSGYGAEGRWGGYGGGAGAGSSPAWGGYSPGK